MCGSIVGVAQFVDQSSRGEIIITSSEEVKTSDVVNADMMALLMKFDRLTLIWS